MKMTNLYESILMLYFTYSYIFVFKRLSKYKNSNVYLEIKCISIIFIIDCIMKNIAIKPVSLGIYYILLEISLYLIYKKREFKFYLFYILTFWVFQVSDLFAGILLYKNTFMFNILSKHSLLDLTLSYLLVIFIAILITNLILKLENININITFKENKLLCIYTNIFVFIYMLLVYFFNNPHSLQSITAVVFVLIIFLFISYVLFGILNKLYIEKHEKSCIEMYNNIIEESLDNLKTFKHDYKNMLLSIGGFLDNDDLDGLKKYFNENIYNNKYIDNKHLYGLINIQNSPVKGLLHGKISSSALKGLNLNIHIENSIHNFIIKDIDICKILGILIDNAIEASIESHQKLLNIGISNDESDIYIIVSNSFKNTPIIHKIFEKGYSTKGNDRGLGLNIVRELNEKKYPNMIINSEIRDNLFHMEIMIKK